ncbi:MAPEG family protein [Nodosilinea sp. PGN35]|uniref:MAPEG family protein n=1 Tax=Nodosilinea sp. PGN35 TaxID=3020489 RepID=UPI0023B28E5F|nr:MAPEG family protein [Nodosilinea sp. TSF1-S3]MDF0368492.1 MAPEG family protein [Nodosilinea sp. TSF1-S3]
MVSVLTMPGFLLVSLGLAALLVYLPFLVVGYGRFAVGYDQAAPRAMLSKLPPYAQRATWAHENAFESMILFTPAALMAYITGQQSGLALGAAIAYLIARTLYPAAYILNVPIGRSLMFAVANLSTFTLYFLSCRSALM